MAQAADAFARITYCVLGESVGQLKHHSALTPPPKVVLRIYFPLLIYFLYLRPTMGIDTSPREEFTL